MTVIKILGEEYEYRCGWCRPVCKCQPPERIYTLKTHKERRRYLLKKVVQ